MAITPEEARRELARRELARRESLKQKQPISQEKKQGITLQPSAAGPLGMLFGLDKKVGDFVGQVIRSSIEPPATVFGRAGQSLESILSGQPPQEYSIPMPESWGGDIPISPARNMLRALLPALGTAVQMPALAPARSAAALGKVTKFDNALVQAQKSKIALDETRRTLGQAKEIAMQEIKGLPVDFDWSDIPEKALNVLKKPDSKVLFDESGSIVNTVENLDRVKMLLQDMPSQKDFVEAGKMVTGEVIRYAGKVRDAIVSTAKRAGKPELGKALSDYHDFMREYNLINDHLTDKYGNALANKLKSTFKFSAEPRIKEAWKEVGKLNPEIKGVMKSRQMRELLKGLLVLGGTTVGLAAGGKKVLDLISVK